MKTRYRWIAGLLLMAVLLSACGGQTAPATAGGGQAAQARGQEAQPTPKGEETGETYQALLASLAEDAVNTIQMKESYVNHSAGWKREFMSLPERYDLRDIGVVPAVRNQGNWGTCWGFASIASSETSILSELNMTMEDYAAKFGRELDLSEKHLAWFGTGHLPELSDYPEGEYPYDYPWMVSQAGEGLYQRDYEDNPQAARYNAGGVMMMASGLFASCTGPVPEALVPYAAADGTDSTAADWTLDEELRDVLYFEMEDSSILPSPAQRDENGEYVYVPEGTEAIKSEIFNGRAVSIGYHADVAMSPEAEKKRVQDAVEALGFEPADEELELYLAVRSGETRYTDLTREELISVGRIRFPLAGTDISGKSDDELYEMTCGYYQAREQAAAEAAEDMAAAAAAAAEAEEAARAMADALGMDYDEYLRKKQKAMEADSEVYINTDTYAQYTDNCNASGTHAVAIIGWDDTYPAENFLAEHRPPADGAWIVRNSWGPDYGIDGYFYLSYYDQTITMPETFDFLVADLEERTAQMMSIGYDNMQAEKISVFSSEETVGMANVFEITEDMVLSSVSIVTGEMNTHTSVAVYLLNENAASPTDGKMLDIVTADYPYSGYHRVWLGHNYLLPAGARVSVVQQQVCEEGGHYNIPYTTNTNEEYMKVQNIFETDEMNQTRNWAVGYINEGESFVNLDGVWTDWADVIARHYDACDAAGYLSYDNLSMKLYVYPPDEIRELHELSGSHIFNSSEIQVCNDCGYALVVQPEE